MITPKSKTMGIVNNTKEVHKFVFNDLFGMAAQQEEVFKKVAQDVADAGLEGYNGTIFAYGQTGSGKTFTITGGAERYADRGIIPRTLSYLFKEMKKREEMINMMVSYLELYNNAVSAEQQNGTLVRVTTSSMRTITQRIYMTYQK